MTSRRRVLHGLIFASVIALPLAQGCGGDDAAVNNSNPADDGGGGDSTTTTGGDSSTPTDGSTPTDSSSPPDAFCAAVAAFDSRCSLTDACDVAKAANCSKDEGVASAGGIAAYEACEAQEPCSGGVTATDDGGLKAYDDCLAAHFGTPTTAETSIVTAYCTRCGGGSAACDTGPVARNLVAYSDTILGEIQLTCLDRDGGADDGGIGGKCANFDKCSRDIIEAVDPQPAACNDE
jgi:hypothetical protein